MSASTATRERILDAAMELFGDHGFRGTSVAAIERRAGLTPGAGGMYHHFRSKDEVLTAGLERHLARLGALRDIRRLFAGVGDLRVQLTLTARYVLRELQAERELLNVLVTEARSRPDLVAGAVTTVLERSHEEFAGWLVEEWGLAPERAPGLASIALGALVSRRMLAGLLPVGATAVDDEGFVTAWVDTLERALQPQNSH